jgi:nucleotidyltransferase/DNA polymerase involved in DNA repair
MLDLSFCALIDWIKRLIHHFDKTAPAIRLTQRLAERGITTVEGLRTADPKVVRREYSVVVERTVAELNGTPCMELDEVAPRRQEIQSSRSFGRYVQDLGQLEEAVATYIATAAWKLRSQQSLAKRVQVYLRTNPFKPARPQYQQAITVPLTVATDDTLRLTHAALWGAATNLPIRVRISEGRHYADGVGRWQHDASGYVLPSKGQQPCDAGDGPD